VPGQRVSKEDVLFEMDADDFAIDVRIARSEIDEARARVRGSGCS
jgi:multidrug resistance efflux pump